MVSHEPVHQQLYYLWPLHTYINRISVILTLCYFYMNTKEARYAFSTRHRLGWVGLGLVGVEKVNTGGVNQILRGGGNKTAVKGEIFFIFFKDREPYEEE